LDRAETKENLKMKRLTITLLTLLVLGGCSSDNEDLKKKIEELEKDVAYKQSVIERLYDDLIAKCTSSREEVTTFGPYTLTENVIYDTDWDCAMDTTIRQGYFEEGVNEAVVRSPTEELHRLGIGLSVEDTGEFYQLSGFTGGRHCCTLDLLLSKKEPYETVFRSSKDGDFSILVGDIDGDGKTEIETKTDIFLYWRDSYAGSTVVKVFLEYSSNAFKLDKDLIYSYVTKEINNIEYDSIKFVLIEEESREDWYGWEDHYIPHEIIEIPGALMFAGREEEAKRFLDYVWPEELPNKDLYWKEFKEMIKGSKYWEN